jgi:hypothetical protein
MNNSELKRLHNNIKEKYKEVIKYYFEEFKNNKFKYLNKNNFEYCFLNKNNLKDSFVKEKIYYLNGTINEICESYILKLNRNIVTISSCISDFDDNNYNFNIEYILEYIKNSMFVEECYKSKIDYFYEEYINCLCEGDFLLLKIIQSVFCDLLVIELFEFVNYYLDIYINEYIENFLQKIKEIDNNFKISNFKEILENIESLKEEEDIFKIILNNKLSRKLDKKEKEKAKIIKI